jgi:hypothetical protein
MREGCGFGDYGGEGLGWKFDLNEKVLFWGQSDEPLRWGGGW